MQIRTAQRPELVQYKAAPLFRFPCKNKKAKNASNASAHILKKSTAEFFQIYVQHLAEQSRARIRAPPPCCVGREPVDTTWKSSARNGPTTRPDAKCICCSDGLHEVREGFGHHAYTPPSKPCIRTGSYHANGRAQSIRESWTDSRRLTIHPSRISGGQAGDRERPGIR